MIVRKVGSKSELDETSSWSHSFKIRLFLGNNSEGLRMLLARRVQNTENRRQTMIPTSVFLLQELTHVRKLVQIWMAKNICRLKFLYQKWKVFLHITMINIWKTAKIMEKITNLLPFPGMRKCLVNKSSLRRLKHNQTSQSFTMHQIQVITLLPLLLSSQFLITMLMIMNTTLIFTAKSEKLKLAKSYLKLQIILRGLTFRS